MKLTHCKMCGCTLAKFERLYCKVCSAYMKVLRTKAYDLKTWRESKRENVPVILVEDPSDAPLTAGMTIPVEEHKWMVKLMTYTPGTVIRQGDERKRIDMVNGRMVEVRI